MPSSSGNIVGTTIATAVILVGATVWLFYWSFQDLTSENVNKNDDKKKDSKKKKRKSKQSHSQKEDDQKNHSPSSHKSKPPEEKKVTKDGGDNKSNRKVPKSPKKSTKISTPQKSPANTLKDAGPSSGSTTTVSAPTPAAETSIESASSAILPVLPQTHVPEATISSPTNVSMSNISPQTSSTTIKISEPPAVIETKQNVTDAKLEVVVPNPIPQETPPLPALDSTINTVKDADKSNVAENTVAESNVTASTVPALPASTVAESTVAANIVAENTVPTSTMMSTKIATPQKISALDSTVNTLKDAGSSSGSTSTVSTPPAAETSTKSAAPAILPVVPQTNSPGVTISSPTIPANTVAENNGVASTMPASTAPANAVASSTVPENTVAATTANASPDDKMVLLPTPKMDAAADLSSPSNSLTNIDKKKPQNSCDCGVELMDEKEIDSNETTMPNEKNPIIFTNKTEILPMSYERYHPINLTILPDGPSQLSPSATKKQDKKEETTLLTPFKPILHSMYYAHRHALVIEDLIQNYQFLED